QAGALRCCGAAPVQHRGKTLRVGRLRADFLKRQETKLDAVHGDAAHEFGEEVGGFLRHDFAGRGDVPGLFDAAGVEEESDLGGAAVDGVERGGGFAFVGQVFFSGGGGERDAERGLEDAVVK